MSRVTPLLCPLLVGRDDLLDLADRRLADAAEGRGQFLLLAGEAGVGKTRFLGAVRRKASTLGFMFAEGDLAPQDRFVPGALVQDLVRSMLRIRAFPRLGDDFLSLPDSIHGIEFQSRRLLVRDLVDRIAESLEAPAVLALEDLQWADDLSLEILAELARRIRDRPVLMVGAYRTDELPTGTLLREWRARLLTQRMAEEARLAPLTLDQTALMTTLILSTGLPAPREVVAAVHERTDGIPLHIEELLGALGDEARSDGRAIREATVPATIEDAVLARFEHLSPEGRSVAQAGAVIGRCFVPEVLAGIMDLPPDALETPLQELVDQAFLYPFGMQDVGFFDYRHQLLRDVLYQTVPPGRFAASTLEPVSSGPSWKALRRSTHRPISSEQGCAPRRTELRFPALERRPLCRPIESHSSSTDGPSTMCRPIWTSPNRGSCSRPTATRPARSRSMRFRSELRKRPESCTSGPAVRSKQRVC